MSAPFSKYWFLLLNILEQFHHNVLSQIVEKHCSKISSIFSVVLIMSIGVLRFNSSQLTSVMILLTFKWQQQEKSKLAKTKVSFRELLHLVIVLFTGRLLSSQLW